MSITFDGFDLLAEKISEPGGSLKKAVNEALIETHKLLTDELEQAASSYSHNGGGMRGYATGEMYQSIIRNPSVEWAGNVAEIKAGFDLSETFHSIFVMYGTQQFPKNQKIYNALVGIKTKRKIEDLQIDVMNKYIGW